MTAPPKPWEKAGINCQRANTGTLIDQMSSVPSGVPTSFSHSGSRFSGSQNPPPLPPRTSLTQRPALTTGFNGYGYSGYGGYGNVYSPYSSMYGGLYGGYGMNRFGTGVDDGTLSGFAQQAELSSRQAFQSIESVVQAVGSVAAMLESTFQAVYNSFRAVIGVADHMSRLRAHLTRIFSALAIFRTLKWLAYRLLSFIRLRTPSEFDDKLWSQANADAVAGSAAGVDLPGVGRSSWPVMLFFAIVVGGPWLIWKFLSTSSGSNASKGWATGADDHFVAVAEFNFDAENPDELSFQQGDTVNIAPKELQPNVRGWLLASVSGGQKTGLVPANYVKVIGKRRGKQYADQQRPTSRSTVVHEPVLQQNESELAQEFDVASVSLSSSSPAFTSSD